MPRWLFSTRVAVDSWGGAEFETVTVTGADVRVLPAASRAVAVRVCAPSATLDVVQLTLNGEIVSADPSGVPSTKKVTAATPVSSEALAVTGTVPDTVVPPLGDVIVTAGALASGGASLMSKASTTTTKSVEEAFLVRVTSMRSVWEPSARPLVVNTAASTVSADA